MNQVYSFSRLLPFLKYKFVLNYRNWLIQLGAFAAIFTVVSALFFNDTFSSEIFRDYYIAMQVITLFACGFYITSRSFNELSSTSKGFLFMQLPVSTFEKILVPAIFSGLVFPILFILFFAGIGTASNALLSLFYDFEPFRVPIFTDDNVRMLKAYITIQPFFLIGSLKFKKQHLLWTAISLATVLAMFSIVWIPIAKLAYGSNHFELLIFSNNEEGFVLGDLIMLLVMLVGWTISYFTLKEKEV